MHQKTSHIYQQQVSKIDFPEQAPFLAMLRELG